jgi:hypothetical protein
MSILKCFGINVLRTLPSSVGCKFFICHSLAPRETEGYENTGGVAQLFPFWFTQLAPSFEGSDLCEGFTQLAPSFEGNGLCEGNSPLTPST